MKVLSIGLFREKEELKERIRQRVDIMFSQGLVVEIKKLLKMGANPSWQSMQGIGYREFIDKIYDKDAKTSISNLEKLTDSDLEDIKQSIVTNSVHYAKRQMTFFKSFSDVHWINPDDCSQMKGLINSFLK